MTLSVETTSGRAVPLGAIEVIPTGARAGRRSQRRRPQAPRRSGVRARDAGVARPFGGAGPRSGAQRPGADRVQPPPGRSRLGADPGDRAPFRRGPAGNLHRLQRQGERRADRQPGRRRSGVAHRHVVSRRAAEGEHALCARSAAQRRQYLVLHHVRRLRGAAGRAEGAHRRPRRSSTTAPTTAAAMCARVSPRPTIRLPRRAPCIRWSARIPTPAGACSISADAATPIWSGSRLRESEALLDELWSFVDRPEFAWEHVWRVGDLVLWDNRCTMHRRDAFDPSSRRIMHRTQVKGEQRPA